MTFKQPHSPPAERASAAASDAAAPEAADAGEYPSVEELTTRLPASELVKIIKGALECGKRNLPFTQTELSRAMAFGPGSPPGGALRRRTERR